MHWTTEGSSELAAGTLQSYLKENRIRDQSLSKNKEGCCQSVLTMMAQVSDLVPGSLTLSYSDHRSRDWNLQMCHFQPFDFYSGPFDPGMLWGWCLLVTLNMWGGKAVSVIILTLTGSNMQSFLQPFLFSRTAKASLLVHLSDTKLRICLPGSIVICCCIN